MIISWYQPIRIWVRKPVVLRGLWEIFSDFNTPLSAGSTWYTKHASKVSSTPILHLLKYLWIVTWASRLNRKCSGFRLFLYFEYMSIEFETRHLWTYSIRVYIHIYIFIKSLLHQSCTCDKCVVNWYAYLNEIKTSEPSSILLPTSDSFCLITSHLLLLLRCSRSCCVAVIFKCGRKPIK